MMNAAGLYPTQPAAPPVDQFGPNGPQDPNQQQPKRGPMIRRPLGDLASLEASSAPIKLEGQQPEPGPADTTDAGGQMPTAAKGVSYNRTGNADVGFQPHADPRETGLPQVQASTFGPPSPMTASPAPTGAPSPAASPAAAPIQQAPQTPGSAELQKAQQSSAKVGQFGPEPTWNTLPDEQKHHGIRKVLDYLAAAGVGVGTLNPAAGMGMYRQLSRAPLREAQSTWEAGSGAAEGDYKRNIELAKQGTSEEKSAAQEASYKSREEIDQQRLEAAQGRNQQLEERNNQLGKKVVRKYQDGSGNWKAEQADGTIVDTTPEQTAGEKSDETYNARVREADRQGLTGEDRKMFIANGKLSDPAMHVHVPSEASEAYNDWKASFKRDNGREPTAEEINNYRRGGASKPPHAKDRQTFEDHWGRRFQQGEQTKERARQQVLKSYGADRDQSQYETNKGDLEPKLAAIESQWAEEKQKLQEEKDAEADQYGVYNQQPGSSQGSPSQGGAQRKALPAQAKPQQPAQPNQPQQPKVATQQHIQAYAQQKGISVEQAAEEFKNYGYSVR